MEQAMSIGPLNTLSSSYLQSIIAGALQGAGSTSQTNTGSSAVDSSSLVQSSDNSRLSPFAQLLNTLQQLQQTDPTKYQQVTGQIATNLQSAAQTAQSDGNTTAATQLNQLATDFTNASKSGQLPNVQDLAQAVGGHHHHHHSHAAAADPDNSSSTGATSTSSTSPSQTLSQLLSAFQSSSTQAGALNPMSIILGTLSSAGITSSNA
jgi:hypothetical protein